MDTETVNNKKKKILHIIAIAVITALTVAGVGCFVIQQVQAHHLQTSLMEKEWKRHASMGDLYYTLGLDFSEYTADLTFKPDGDDFAKKSVGEYSYIVIDGNTILFTDKYGTETKVKVTLNERYNIMSFEPSLTTSRSSEVWAVEK